VVPGAFGWLLQTGLLGGALLGFLLLFLLLSMQHASESTLYNWAAGNRPIPHHVRPILARLLGCSIEALAPDTTFAGNSHLHLVEYGMIYKEMERYFTFGKIKTAELILDGDGTSLYLPQHIHSHYIPMALELPEEFQMRKERIAQEQEERKAQGDSYQWNGERYNLVKFNIGRDPVNEDMILGLWFRPSDYNTFLVTSTIAQEPKMREKYLASVEWDEAIPLVAHSFSILLTSDGYTLLVQRGKSLGCRPNVFDVSLAEGLSRPVDRSTTDQAPDIYRCAIRGLAEELGLHAPTDFSASDIQFLSFAVDTEFCMWGVFGIVKLQRSVEEVLGNLQRSIRDRFEHRRVFSVPFTPEEVCSFVFSHEPFSPGGLVCLYHALVHEFGREQVNKVILSY